LIISNKLRSDLGALGRRFESFKIYFSHASLASYLELYLPNQFASAEVGNKRVANNDINNLLNIKIQLISNYSISNLSKYYFRIFLRNNISFSKIYLVISIGQKI